MITLRSLYAFYEQKNLNRNDEVDENELKGVAEKLFRDLSWYNVDEKIFVQLKRKEFKAESAVLKKSYLKIKLDQSNKILKFSKSGQHGSSNLFHKSNYLKAIKLIQNLVRKRLLAERFRL